MKKNQARSAAILAIALPILFGYQNCSNNYELKALGNGVVDSGTPSNADSVPIATPAPGQTICNPFGSQGTSTPGSGLVADSIHYLTSAQQSSAISDFNDLWTNSIGNEPVHLQVNEVNVPNRYFTQGFAAADGTVLQSLDGQALSAYFGFKLKGSFVMGDWAPGDYQIAVLSDDGSNLTMQGAVLNTDGTRSDFVINNDGNHSLKLGCSSQIVHIDANSNYPLEFDYYQGPPTTIGLMIVARPVPAGNTQDTYCGVGTGDNFFFDDHNYPSASIPQQPYLNLVARGWVPVNSTHYQLPSSAAPNVCASN